MLVPAEHGLWLPESYFTLAMNPNPRQTQLLELVQAQGSASIEFLAETFSVTLQTVRRDVQRLSEAGLLSEPAFLFDLGVVYLKHYAKGVSLIY